MTAWSSDAERPAMEDGLQYHIRCRAGDVSRFVLLPGDPARVDAIAAGWREARLVADNREYRTFSGLIDSDPPVPVTCCSTGIGGSSAAIALEELAELGADTFVRVGTCGAISESVRCGDVVICSGAMRRDGVSRDYVDISYPALAHRDVLSALVAACGKLGLRHHVGVTCTTASFHLGQARPGFRGFRQGGGGFIDDLVRAGVLCFEMETATILTLAGLYGLRAGAILTVVAHRLENRMDYSGSDGAIAAANEAIRMLAG
ncbi:MAG: nucleoside phosphorylase [Synergistaceae bacterium]|jgi:uridine phosphorylase|nr:nucleoside phosphorylase [Synergistaceae bacterium]